MKLKRFFFLLLFCGWASLYAGDRDSLPTDRHSHHHLAGLYSSNGNGPLFRYGFRIGAAIPFSKQFSTEWTAKRVLAADFGIFVKIGKYVFADIGFGYAFQKNRFAVPKDSTRYDNFDETVELRYLQIPLKLSGEIALGETVMLQPHAGLIYQPLIHVTKNVLNFTKKTLINQHFLLTAGLGLKVRFITLDIAYRYSFRPYVKNDTYGKGSALHIAVGFQF